MLSLHAPFELYTLKKLRDRVYSGENKRPLIPDDWPSSIRRLLEHGWSPDWDIRPTMKEVETSLRKECVRARGGNENGLEHKRRRSTHVYPGKK